MFSPDGRWIAYVSNVAGPASWSPPCAVMLIDVARILHGAQQWP
jgi:hypothetical protein